MKQYLSLLLAIICLNLVCCVNPEDEGKTIVEFRSATKGPEKWELQLGSPVRKTVQFETDKKGHATIKMDLDTIYPAFFWLRSSNFTAQTWLEPGEKCEVFVDKNATLEEQIRTTGVFADRTIANYSKEFGDFYQLLADDNFKVPLTGTEDEYAAFLLSSYQEHLDTIAKHTEWSPAVLELAIKTLNDKQYFHIIEPYDWLAFCASLRGFKEETLPKDLPDQKKTEIYNLTIGKTE